MKHQVAAVSAALRNIDLKFHFLWELGVCTGLRISDLLTLKPQHITGCKFTVTEVKTKNIRNIEIPMDTFCLLHGYISLMRLKQSDYLFFSSHKGIKKRDMPMSRQWAWRVISSVARQIGLEMIGTHSMRKIYACGYFVKSGSIQSVQKELGHKHMSTTLIYLKDLLEKS
jgi:integrase